MDNLRDRGSNPGKEQKNARQLQLYWGVHFMRTRNSHGHGFDDSIRKYHIPILRKRDWNWPPPPHPVVVLWPSSPWYQRPNKAPVLSVSLVQPQIWLLVYNVGHLGHTDSHAVQTFCSEMKLHSFWGQNLLGGREKSLVSRIFGVGVPSPPPGSVTEILLSR